MTRVDEAVTERVAEALLRVGDFAAAWFPFVSDNPVFLLESVVTANGNRHRADGV